LSQLSLATPATAKPGNIWAEELDTLVPRRFLMTTPFAQLTHLPRYLKALATRMERAKLNPARDRERVDKLAPYLVILKQREAEPPKSALARQRLENFRWLLEEYKVSLFAQELGTAIPVSPKRLDEQLQQL
jgi:ATP-dependent helicase HrpA